MTLNYKIVLAIFALLCLSWPGCLSMSKAAKPGGLALKYLAQPMMSGPCLPSLVTSPSEQNNCMQWVGNVDGAPTYELSRRLVFTGSGDNYLHILDADSGRIFGRIPTVGRVVTYVVFSPDGTKMYFGTDQGVIVGYDAFSFKKIFSFQADSRINNDLIIIADSVVFSTGLATVYRINREQGNEYWQLKRPVNPGRIKLASYSNILFLKNDHSFAGTDILAVPHPDGFVSILEFADGQMQHNIQLGTPGAKGAFPDVVAPMLYLGGTIWVASYDRGIVRLDPRSGQVVSTFNINEVQQLVADSERVYAATSQSLMALSMGGNVIWKKDFNKLKTKGARYGFPFVNFNPGSKRVLNGLPSRLLLNDGGLIMATSLGAMAMFDQRNGNLWQVVGNSLGFGPKIGFFGGEGVFALTPRGSLALFLFEKLRKGGNQL